MRREVSDRLLARECPVSTSRGQATSDRSSATVGRNLTVAQGVHEDAMYRRSDAAVSMHDTSAVKDMRLRGVTVVVVSLVMAACA